MRPWQAAAIVTGVVVATLVLLLAFGSLSGAGDEPSPLPPSSSEVALTAGSLVVLVFGILWLVFAVLRVMREHRDGAR